MGSTNVAKNNWPGLAVGAAITGTGIAIGENGHLAYDGKDGPELAYRFERFRK